jgi:hypothetical protein
VQLWITLVALVANAVNYALICTVHDRGAAINCRDPTLRSR